jgi:hypothetical protein
MQHIKGCHKKMPKRNLKKPIITMLTAVAIFLTLCTFNLVSASSGSIAMANAYPEDKETYLVVNHFMYQTTAVNTNTTVSVSIDNGPPIPMAFQGIRNEIVNGDAAPRDWYTWQLTVPAITNPSKHTFQFFSHYYVWQDIDNYWAEFNAYSTSRLFTIANPFSTPTTSTPTSAPSVTLTPTLMAQAQPTDNSMVLYAVIGATTAIAVISVALFMLKKRK